MNPRPLFLEKKKETQKYHQSLVSKKKRKEKGTNHALHVVVDIKEERKTERARKEGWLGSE